MTSTLNAYRSEHNNNSLLFYSFSFLFHSNSNSNWSQKRVFIPRNILSQVCYFFWPSVLAKCGSCYYYEMLTVLKSRTPAAEAFRSPNRNCRLITVNYKDTCNIYQVKNHCLEMRLDLIHFKLLSTLASCAIIF